MHAITGTTLRLRQGTQVGCTRQAADMDDDELYGDLMPSSGEAGSGLLRGQVAPCIMPRSLESQPDVMNVMHAQHHCEDMYCGAGCRAAGENGGTGVRNGKLVVTSAAAYSGGTSDGGWHIIWCRLADPPARI